MGLAYLLHTTYNLRYQLVNLMTLNCLKTSISMQCIFSLSYFTKFLCTKILPQGTNIDKNYQRQINGLWLICLTLGTNKDRFYFDDI